MNRTVVVTSAGTREDGVSHHICGIAVYYCDLGANDLSIGLVLKRIEAVDVIGLVDPNELSIPLVSKKRVSDELLFERSFGRKAVIAGRKEKSSGDGRNKK